MTDLTLRGALLVAAGAVVGALLRWTANAVFPREFPYATLVVNVVGSFLVGVVMFGGVARGWWSEEVRLLLVVGLLGAFTTMSSFAYDTVGLWSVGETRKAWLNFALNPLLCVAAVWLGRLLVLRTS